MYFDVVINSADFTIVYNNTPAEVKSYLKRISASRRAMVHVMEGYTMQACSVEEYLSK